MLGFNYYNGKFSNFQSKGYVIETESSNKYYFADKDVCISENLEGYISLNKYLEKLKNTDKKQKQSAIEETIKTIVELYSKIEQKYGLYYCDLKPENIMIKKLNPGDIKLIDLESFLGKQEFFGIEYMLWNIQKLIEKETFYNYIKLFSESFYLYLFH